MIEVEPYRIGYGPIFRIGARWRLHKAGYGWRLPDRSFHRRTSDRWHRCWQAEWTGCQRAVRAWTKRGVVRKAMHDARDGAP